MGGIAIGSSRSGASARARSILGVLGHYGPTGTASAFGMLAPGQTNHGPASEQVRIRRAPESAPRLAGQPRTALGAGSEVGHEANGARSSRRSAAGRGGVRAGQTAAGGAAGYVHHRSERPDPERPGP